MSETETETETETERFDISDLWDATGSGRHLVLKMNEVMDTLLCDTLDRRGEILRVAVFLERYAGPGVGRADQTRRILARAMREIHAVVVANDTKKDSRGVS